MKRNKDKPDVNYRLGFCTVRFEISFVTVASSSVFGLCLASNSISTVLIKRGRPNGFC